MELGEQVMVTEVLRAYEPSLTEDPLLLALPRDIAVFGDTVAILDNGSSRIVFTDTLFRLRGSIGSEGSGPGELKGAATLVAENERLYVGETTNGRISVFTRAGEFLGTRSLPVFGGSSFAVGAQREIFVRATTGSSAFAVVDTLGGVADFGQPAPSSSEPSEFDLAAGINAPLISRTATGDLHVFDNSQGSLLHYAADGELQKVRSIPAEIYGGMERLREQAAADFGEALASAPLAKSLTVTSSGDLLLLFISDDTYGLLIAPETYEAQPLRFDEGIDSHPVANASTALLVGETLYTIANGGIYALETQLETPLQ